MQIDFQQLNTLINVWIGVGIVLIISIFAVALVVVFYFLSKISDDDNKRFEKES